MGHDMIPLFALFSVFGSVSFIAYLFFNTRNRERMALIEQGQDASIFVKPHDRISMTLRLGLLAVGVGLGILTAEALYNSGFREDVAFPAMIFLMGGAGLLMAYLIEERALKKTNDDRSVHHARTRQSRSVEHPE